MLPQLRYISEQQALKKAAKAHAIAIGKNHKEPEKQHPVKDWENSYDSFFFAFFHESIEEVLFLERTRGEEKRLKKGSFSNVYLSANVTQQEQSSAPYILLYESIL